MANRGLEDWEISIIKRMMEEGYARDKMHAYFNRPERTLTPAAYSEIKVGKIGPEVPVAGSEVLSRFVDGFAKSREEAEKDPIGAFMLSRMVAIDSETDCLKEKESDHVEFKAGFTFADNAFSKVVRAMAALANNSGGYILCGIEDGTGAVKGLSSPDVFDCDPSRWSQALKSALMPVPVFGRIIVEVAGKKIGVLYVEPAENKPVVAIKKLGEKIREGAIYYRYPGESREIGYGELSSILADRDRRAQQTLLKTLNLFAERSPSDVAVIDLKRGELVDTDVAENGAPIQLSKEFVDQLSVIKEGEFVETKGAPAVRILANANIVVPDSVMTQVVRGFVSDQSSVKNFIANEDVQEPIQYFLAAINSSSDWLPLFHWMRVAGVSTEKAMELIESENLSAKRRSRALERLAGERSAWVKPLKSISPIVTKLLKGEVPEVSSATDLRKVMQAIRGIDGANEAQIRSLREALKIGYDFAWAPANGGDLQSYVKAAAGRVDELEAKHTLALAPVAVAP